MSSHELLHAARERWTTTQGTMLIWWWHRWVLTLRYASSQIAHLPLHTHVTMEALCIKLVALSGASLNACLLTTAFSLMTRGSTCRCLPDHDWRKTKWTMFFRRFSASKKSFCLLHIQSLIDYALFVVEAPAGAEEADCWRKHLAHVSLPPGTPSHHSPTWRMCFSVWVDKKREVIAWCHTVQQ